ncbi:MAG: holo-ACP synthase [Firmicutes bacterium]|nr:holo-ACP synthase [Bacillota bacterium]
MTGVDIVQTARIARLIQNERFFGAFTQGEIDYFKSKGSKPETLAGIFAAKEAAAKALGTGFSGFSPREIEIAHSVRGAPHIILHGGAQQAASGGSVHISIAHDGDYAIAFALWQKE